MSTEGFTCGTGGWTGPVPGDPDDIIFLQATPAYGGVDLNWSFPLTRPYAIAHMLLYRGITDVVGSAQQIAVVAGNYYFDLTPEDINVEYFYWIQVVSINGTYGRFNGPASAVPMPAIGKLIEQLTDQIDRGLLAQTLKTDIDKIAVLEDGLTQEATYRQQDSLVIAEAFNGLQATVDETVALVLQETTARSTGDSALASQITTVQSQLGSDLASAQTTLQTNISTVNGKVTEIGALYTAKVSVNGLVGGFGVYNNGTEVQAGFDVDTFWIGRTALNKRKPFIVSGDVVYIDSAAIANASITDAHITTLNASKINTGYLSADRINAGSITADKIDTRNLTIKDSFGNIIFGSGNNLDWSKIANQPSNIYNGNITIGSNGALTGGGGGQVSLGGLGAGAFATLSQITSGNVGTYIANAAISNAYISNLDAAKINTGFISADRLQAGTITADKINSNGLLIRDTGGTVILGSGSALHPSYAASGTVNADLAPSIASAAATAVWSSVSGAGKPQDNATWGANFDTNMQGKLRASNIWTYMDTGIISSAFIGEAAITSAKIGTAEVGTLKIAGNAVTTQVLLERTDFSTRINTKSITVPVGTGGPVVMNLYVKPGSQPDIFINGALVMYGPWNDPDAWAPYVVAPLFYTAAAGNMVIDVYDDANGWGIPTGWILHMLLTQR